MSAENKNVAVSGLAGAITSLIVGSVDGVIGVSPNIRAILTIGSGIIGAIVAFEIISWLVVWRLRRLKVALDKMTPRLEEFRSTLNGAIKRQVDEMIEKKASQQSIDEINGELVKASRRMVDVLVEIDKKGVELLREIAS